MPIAGYTPKNRKTEAHAQAAFSLFFVLSHQPHRCACEKQQPDSANIKPTPCQAYLCLRRRNICFINYDILTTNLHADLLAKFRTKFFVRDHTETR